MRFRHAVHIERPRSAVAAFRLVADLRCLAERHPDLPPMRVVGDHAGGPGHTVEIGGGPEPLRITVARLGPGLAVTLRYSNGITQQWRVTDHDDAGCLVAVEADVDGLAPGEKAEMYRGGLLADLAAIKRIVEHATPSEERDA